MRDEANMTQQFDFERAWQAKFARYLDQVAGPQIREVVMDGSESLSDATDPLDVIQWTQGAMDLLSTHVDESGLKSIMAGCACQYPRSDLQEVRREFEARQDFRSAHRMLQIKFEHFLEVTLGLDEDLVTEIMDRGWGLAGVIQGETIIATKIPKSGYLVEYLEETDPDKKRQLYCHCPRVRDALSLLQTLPSTYCYCGAGFYKGIWEEIVQKPVEVEVLESVLSGGEVCRVAIHLS
jgi:hypothetical protein